MDLDLTSSTWLLFIATTVFWASSAWLAVDRNARETLTWRVIPLSLFGFAWLGFGAFFIFRFLILLYDPIYFEATNFSLTKIAATGLTRSWTCLAIYWVAFCLGFKIMLWWQPPTPRIIINLEELSSTKNYQLMDAIAIIATILLVVTHDERFPRSLVTPIGDLASLYILPLLIAWLWHYQGQDIGLRRFLYLIPGIVSYLLNPYRVIIIFLLAGICLPALRIKKTFSLTKLMIGIVLFLMVITVMNNSYRRYVWGSTGEYNQGSLSEQWETWMVRPYLSPWWILATRFHGFDSLALTLYAVPRLIPFSERHIVHELLVGGLVPRMILDTKVEKSRSREFSRQHLGVRRPRLHR